MTFQRPHDADFWYAQRTAVTELEAVGYATTTDIQRATHPPDKQDVAVRVGLELERVAYGSSKVVSRGPELLHVEATPPTAATTSSSSKTSGGGGSGNVTTVVLTFSNASLISHGGILVANGSDTRCGFSGDTMATDAMTNTPLNYTIKAANVIVECRNGVGSSLVQINGDKSVCFLYGPTGLPAPPVLVNCSQN